MAMEVFIASRRDPSLPQAQECPNSFRDTAQDNLAGHIFGLLRAQKHLGPAFPLRVAVELCQTPSRKVLHSNGSRA